MRLTFSKGVIMKQRLEIRIDEDMRAGLEIEAQRTGKPLTAVVEAFIEQGLARSQGKLIEVESLPLMREAVREETGKVMAQLYEKLRTDLAAHSKRADDRLAALIMKAVRFAGLGQRMLYMFIVKQTGQRDADRIYETAKEQTGKDLARPSKEGESAP
jgi:hypothetical protein